MPQGLPPRITMLLREEVRTLRNLLLQGAPPDVWVPQIDLVEDMTERVDYGVEASQFYSRTGLSVDQRMRQRLERDAELKRRRRRSELLGHTG